MVLLEKDIRWRERVGKKVKRNSGQPGAKTDSDTSVYIKETQTNLQHLLLTPPVESNKSVRHSSGGSSDESAGDGKSGKKTVMLRGRRRLQRIVCQKEAAQRTISSD